MLSRKTLLGDDPHGYAAADAANDHLFYHGYDDDNDDDYYDDDDSEWANSYNFCDITDADMSRKTPLIQPILRMKAPIIMTCPMMTIRKITVIMMMMLTVFLGKTSSLCYYKTSLLLYPLPLMPSLNNLIESPTDKSIHTKNNNNLRTTPKRTKQSAYQGFGPKPKHVWNGESYQTATSLAHAQQIQQTRKKFNKKFIDTKNNNNNTSVVFRFLP